MVTGLKLVPHLILESMRNNQYHDPGVGDVGGGGG